MAPDWEPIGKGRFYFYRAGSVEHAVHHFWNEHHRRDDSVGLRIRGDSETACEARSRWRRGLSIPVVEPAELEAFLEGRKSQSISGPQPSADPVEQDELFLRNLLDFDDWRRAQRAGVCDRA